MKNNFFTLAFIAALALNTFQTSNVSATETLTLPVKVDNVTFMINFSLTKEWEIENKGSIAALLEGSLPASKIPGFLRRIQETRRTLRFIANTAKHGITSDEVRRMAKDLLPVHHARELFEHNTSDLNDADIISALGAARQRLEGVITLMERNIPIVASTLLHQAIRKAKRRSTGSSGRHERMFYMDEDLEEI